MRIIYIYREMMTNTMMFFSSVLIQYLCMSLIMTNSAVNITNSLGKVYISIIMGLLMVTFSIAMHNFNIKKLLPFVILLFVFIFLYKVQFGVTDREYLKEMIEHHSMALLTSEQILKKTNKSFVADIAQRISVTQKNEIQEMRNIIQTL